MTESGIIPARADRAQCKTCLDEGYIEVDPGCTCGAKPEDGHDVMCGFVPCPEGCADHWEVTP